MTPQTELDRLFGQALSIHCNTTAHQRNTPQEEMHMSKTFTAACRDFFGFKEGQKLGDFAAELKQLTPQDKQEIYEGFKAIGVECEPPQSSV